MSNFIITLSLFFCSIVFCYAQSDSFRIIHKELVLAREVCDSNHFSILCSDGFEDYRGYRLLLNLNEDNVLQSYEDTVYMLSTFPIIDSLKKRGQPYFYPWSLDSIIKKAEANAEYSDFKVSGKVKRYVNKRLRKISSRHRFDGTVRFTPLKIDFESVYLGDRKITFLHNDGRIYGQPCKVYCITQIFSVAPLVKK